METIFGGGDSLLPHPDTPARGVANVSFSFVWHGAGNWAFDFSVAAAPEALRLPAAAEPGRIDGLWEHTCFELFLLDPASGAYFEFNFSPSGQWAAYRFDDYRAGRRALDVTPPRVITSDPAQFGLGMAAHLRTIGLDDESIRTLLELQPPAFEAPTHFVLNALLQDSGFRNEVAWRGGVSAVIEEADGTKSYWALAHPPGAPDFHRSDCFALELPAAKPV